MNWLQQFLFWQKFKETHAKEQLFLNWAQVNRLALVLSAPLLGSKSELDQWILKSNKQVEVYYIESTAKQTSFSDWQCFTKFQSTWYQLPNAACLQSIQPRHYDVVICLSKTINYFEQSLVAQLKAKLKLSALTSLPFYALTIERGETISNTDYLNNCVHYLTLLHTNQHASI